VKFLLHAYRPSGLDKNDPAMAEALAQAGRDPALRAWFEREQTHSAVISAKLRSIEPPAGLRDAILAGARASQIAQRKRSRWRQPLWLGLAASLALLLAFGAWWRFAPVPGDTVDEFALNFVTRKFFLQKRGHEVAELKNWLVAQGGPLPGELPAEFARLRALGCRKVKFVGRNLSLVCFERDGKEFHVFVARRDEFPPSLAPRGPPLFEKKDHVVASWSDAQNYYVLVSNAGRAAVEQML
jgi:hypothetical protein